MQMLRPAPPPALSLTGPRPVPTLSPSRRALVTARSRRAARREAARSVVDFPVQRFRPAATPPRGHRDRKLAPRAMEVPNLPGFRSNRHAAAPKAQSLNVSTDVHGRTASYTAGARSRPYQPPRQATTKGAAYSPSRRDAPYHAAFRQRELRETGRLDLPFAHQRTLPQFLRHDKTGNHGYVRKTLLPVPPAAPPARLGRRGAGLLRPVAMPPSASPARPWPRPPVWPRAGAESVRLLQGGCAREQRGRLPRPPVREWRLAASRAARPCRPEFSVTRGLRPRLRPQGPLHLLPHGRHPRGVRSGAGERGHAAGHYAEAHAASQARGRVLHFRRLPVRIRTHPRPSPAAAVPGLRRRC